MRTLEATRRGVRLRDMTARGVLAFSLALLLLAPVVLMGASEAQAAKKGWVRDGLRFNMRAGPGNHFRILKVLKSGDPITQIADANGWINVRAADGREGWVPEGYTSFDPPPSVALPQLQAKLEAAEARVKELETKLGDQTEAITEVETLRSRNLELEEANIRLVGSSRWKLLGIGALITLVGIALGATWPRGSRSRRIKL